MRRNKFMCELLAATRRIPIEPPGGTAPPLGDPANPSYSVAISDREADAARTKHAAEAEESRLYPTGGGVAMFLPEGVSSGMKNPAQAMFGGLTARRNGSLAEGRGSVDEMWGRR